MVYLLPHSDLRPVEAHSKYLRDVKSHYNYRLVKPEKNLTTKEECKAVEGFKPFYQNYKGDVLDCSIGAGKKGWFS